MHAMCRDTAIEFAYYWGFAWWIATAALSDETRYDPLWKPLWKAEFSVAAWAVAEFVNMWCTYLV